MRYSDYQRFLFLPRFSVWGSYGRIRSVELDCGHEEQLLSLFETSTTSCLHDLAITDTETEENKETFDTRVTCYVVCDKYFTTEADPDPENCWSCGHVVCKSCTTNQSSLHANNSAKNVLVCLHCDFGKSHQQSEGECMCLF